MILEMEEIVISDDIFKLTSALAIVRNLGLKWTSTCRRCGFIPGTLLMVHMLSW